MQWEPSRCSLVPAETRGEKYLVLSWQMFEPARAEQESTNQHASHRSAPKVPLVIQLDSVTPKLPGCLLCVSHSWRPYLTEPRSPDTGVRGNLCLELKRKGWEGLFSAPCVCCPAPWEISTVHPPCPPRKDGPSLTLRHNWPLTWEVVGRAKGEALGGCLQGYF